MGKFFEDRKFEKKERKQPKVDDTYFVKQNLMKSVDRNTEVRKAVEKWLFSFDGALTKSAFERQMKRLNFDDTKALEQLERAKGRRTIPLPPPPKLPVLEKSLLEQMSIDTYIAIRGRYFKEAIKKVITELKQFGIVYVLSIEKLILEFKSYNDKGEAPFMIDKAIECDFLIIVDLEMPIHLEWHINEAIERIGRVRELKGLPIIATWNRINDCKAFFKRFKIYEVKELL